MKSYHKIFRYITFVVWSQYDWHAFQLRSLPTKLSNGTFLLDSGETLDTVRDDTFDENIFPSLRALSQR